MALQKGDILGHEVRLSIQSLARYTSVIAQALFDATQFMGKVFKVGSNVKNLEPGQRVVSSFQIACGKCTYCRENLSSFCDRTNNSSCVAFHSLLAQLTGFLTMWFSSVLHSF